MKFPLKAILNVVSIFVPAVGVAVTAAEQIPTLKGKQKQDAAIEIVKASLQAAEQIADKDLLGDPEVEAASRAVIDAVVAFQNVVKAKKLQAAPAPALA